MLPKLLIAIPDELMYGLNYANFVLAVIAGLVIGIGLAGRRAGWGPRCRKCSFDLRAVPESATKCPECGAVLTHRRAIVYGARSRRWGMVTFGTLLLAAMIASVYFRLPTAAIQWREQVLADAFDLNSIIDLAKNGNARALADLRAELAGTSRRPMNRMRSSPGQTALIAVVDRMETDPESRTTLLPLIFQGNGTGAVMWVRESVVSVRLARILGEVAATDSALFDKLSPSTLNQVFQSSNNPAISRELLAQPALVARLYRGSPGVETHISSTEGPLIQRIAPSFGGQDELWMQHAPLALTVSAADWRKAGGTDQDWQRVKFVRRSPMTACADMELEGMPETGTIEVRVRGAVVHGPEAVKLHQHFSQTDLRDEPPLATDTTPGAVPPPPTIPFEWKRTIQLKPRSELVLTPAAPGPVASWLESVLGRASLVPDPNGGAGKYVVMCEVMGSINSAMVELSWTLEQDGKTWPLAAINRDGDERKPPVAKGFDGFDPAKPFALHAEPDVEAVRAKALRDGEYLDLKSTLKFEAVNRTPKDVQIQGAGTTGLQPGLGGSRR